MNALTEVTTGFDALDNGEIQTVIGLFSRDHIDHQRHPQRIERTRHHFYLRQIRVIFAVTILNQPPGFDFMVA